MIQSYNKIIHNTLILKKEEFINIKLKNKPIIFIGMMGSGKTALGRMMAEKLKRKFYDTDQVIEEKFGCSIREIFENIGENKFREIEYKELLKFRRGNFIISTGGGAYIYPKSHKQINKYGFTIWIYASRTIIINRIKNNKNRPLLLGSDIPNKVEALLKERNPIYTKAKIRVNSTNENKNVMLSNTINSIVKHLNDNENG